MIAIFLVLIGFFLSIRLVKQTDLIARVGYTLLFSAAAVPFVVINVSLFGRIYISKTLIWIGCAAFMLILSKTIFVYIKEFKWPRPAGKDLIILLIGLLVAVFSWNYFNNTEFFLSLGSYLQRGEAKCFPMQTFRLIAELNPKDPGSPPAFFNIISTPGNALFTAPLVPVFGIHTARVIYTLFQILLFLFSFLFLRFLTGRHWLSAVVALFAVFNPYNLSIEVLDRNLMAFALSATLFYTVFAHKEHSFFHGLLFGITAGTGLRFLPVTFILPILLFYFRKKTPPRSYAFLGLGFLIIFPVNIPHLFHHGFHSLGESTPFWVLLWQAISQWPRTPLMPYPNGIFYTLNLLNFWGLILTALVFFGAIKLFIQDRWKFIMLFLAIIPTCVVLAIQKDWIEGDKYRILLTIFLPLVAFLAFALSSIIQEGKTKAKFNAILLCATFAFLLVGGFLIRGVDSNADMTMTDRKPVYQSDSKLFMKYYREHFGDFGAFPNYHRLCFKTDFARKRKQEETIRNTFFAPGTPMAENPWVQKWLHPDNMKPLGKEEFSDQFINVQIDLERLVTRMEDAVHVLGATEDFFVNFEKEKDLLDIYHKEVKASWQPEALPITILPGRPEYTALKELNVELNAFIGLGQDEFGFVQVNSVNYVLKPERIPRGRATAMTALPQTDTKQEIVIRVPRDLTIVVRDWTVDGTKGVPHRIDSWIITFDKQSNPSVEFFYYEPESYL